VAAGDVLDRGLALVTGFGSVMVGVLERGFVAFGRGFGATVAGVSFVFVVGVDPTHAREALLSFHWFPSPSSRSRRGTAVRRLHLFTSLYPIQKGPQMVPVYLLCDRHRRLE